MDAAPIRRRLSSIALITTGVALLVTIVAFLAGEFVASRRSSLQELRILRKTRGGMETLRTLPVRFVPMTGKPPKKP